MNNLILTGFGWSEYAAAAAAALKGLEGKSDVAGVSKRRLPEYLETLKSGYKRVYIIGVSLGADEKRLANALKGLKEKGVRVAWVSAFPPGPSQQENLQPYLKFLIGDTETLLEAVGMAFHTDISIFQPFLTDGGRKTPAAVRDFMELLDAAQFAYRNYQDEAIYATAIRYLAEGVNPEAWSDRVRQAVIHFRRYGGRELVGKSIQMRTLQARINRIANFPDARVLILGESGTGKETVAQQIHTKSPRRSEPFYAFNCACVNQNLLESRFFGHEKGAFTGADKQEPGLFELANGGTLFLDEIGELPYEAQGLLLRILEGGRFMRLGGNTEITVDVRLITATNRNLPAMVRDGKFRADLYQRLNVVQLRIPSLREHKEDIKDIADGWWIKHNGSRLSQPNIDALMGYDYPGNVRELLNLLDRATVLGEKDFSELLREHREMNAGLVAEAPDEPKTVPDDLESAIRHHVRHVYEKYTNNLTKTAEALQVSRNTVRKYL